MQENGERNLMTMLMIQPPDTRLSHNITLGIIFPKKYDKDILATMGGQEI